MAVIRPFRAVRPAPEAASKVASVPYDVVNREEAYEIAKNNPLSLLHVTRAEIDLEKTTDAYSEEVYQKACTNFTEIMKNAPLVQEETPKLYVYKLVMGTQVQTGIAATFAVDDYRAGVILKHEKTRKDKEDDRTKHIITTGLQTGPVFLTYRGVERVNEIVGKTAQGKPLYDFTAEDGISHTVWIMDDSDIAEVVGLIAGVDKLYIADGHHRAASAARTGTERQNANPAHTGDEEYNFFLAVLFPAEELNILPYNRVVFSLNGNTGEEFLNKIAECFSVEESDRQVPSGKREFCMYLDKKWYVLKAGSNIKETKTVGDNLDVSILQDNILNPILGIDDPRTSKKLDFIGGIRGTKELIKLVDSGKAEVAFSLYPVSLNDLMQISDAGEIMPPKSTWFEPKLRDGLVIHEI